MENQTYTQKTGQARGQVLRLERDLGQAKGNLKNAIRNRTAGGVILLFGMIALIGRSVIDSQFVVAIAVVGVVIGAWVLIRALLKIGQMDRSVVTITDKVTNAQAKLAELTAQPSAAD